jgi:hypothetical protein
VLHQPGAEWTTWQPRRYPSGPVWKLFFQHHSGNRRKVLLKDMQLVITRLEEDLFECALEPLPVNVPEALIAAPSTPSRASSVPSHVFRPRQQVQSASMAQPEIISAALEELEALNEEGIAFTLCGAKR